ncbi:MAG: feruloyl-CoA synthase, partial [Polaromonas sp.]|nr:feruloyl-CoA synthase [Polaromonas sp.]
TGLNLKEVGALVFPSAACRELSGLGPDASLAEVLASRPVRQRMQAIVDGLARNATGSASRVARVLLMAEPPSAEKGEITDKGSINQRAVLKHRAALVDALHDGSAEHIIFAGGQSA